MPSRTTSKVPASKVLTKPAGVTKKSKKKSPPPKVAPKQAPKPASAPKKAKKDAPELNPPPSDVMKILVFGEGSAGELGLGLKGPEGQKTIDVKRPRLNDRLEKLGIVQLAVGGMHCAALTRDNKIYTWGVNDSGALGRETINDAGKMKDVEDDESSDSEAEDGEGLNPTEAEPCEVDPIHFSEGTRFSALFAADGVTFALTTTGNVYGWGSFRGNDGPIGFTQGVKLQSTPVLIKELKNIKTMALGTNHALALNDKGKIFLWGAGEQSQLGRRVVARTHTGALIPREFGFGRKKIAHIGCGDYHSFAIDEKGDVFSWGLNTFGQTGVAKNSDDENNVFTPTLVESLKGRHIVQINGGAHHTIALTKEGTVLSWGRCDVGQSGMQLGDIPKELLYFDHDGTRARYLEKPLQIPGIKGVSVGVGNDTTVIATTDGKAYSWGFAGNYQTGQGNDEDVEEATLIDNTATKNTKVVFAGVGGQFGVLGGFPLHAN